MKQSTILDGPVIKEREPDGCYGPQPVRLTLPLKSYTPILCFITEFLGNHKPTILVYNVKEDLTVCGLYGDHVFIHFNRSFQCRCVLHLVQQFGFLSSRLSKLITSLKLIRGMQCSP